MTNMNVYTEASATQQTLFDETRSEMVRSRTVKLCEHVYLV